MELLENTTVNESFIRFLKASLPYQMIEVSLCDLSLVLSQAKANSLQLCFGEFDLLN